MTTTTTEWACTACTFLNTNPIALVCEICQTVRDMHRTSKRSHVDDQDDQDEEMHKRVKVDAYPMVFSEGKVCLTYVQGFSRVGYTRFEDLVNKTYLQKAVLSAFQIDDTWLLSKLPSIRLCIIRPRFKDVPKDRYHQVMSRDIVFVYPPEPAGYSWFLRVVIGSGNLVEYDWEVLENVLWVQDFPVLEAETKEHAFGKDLIEVLRLMRVPESVAKELAHVDFGSAKVSLVASVPGNHATDTLSKWGHMRMRDITKQMMTKHVTDDEPVVTYATSSLGSLSVSWLYQFYESASGHTFDTTVNVPPNIKILYPTQRTVDTSKLGPKGAGTITFHRKFWTRADFPKSVLHDLKSIKRPGALSHAKIIKCTSKTGGWFYCGSHNATSSAWGTIVKGKLRISNWELGVVMDEGVVPFEETGRYGEGDVPWFYRD
ncbi:hypothetical protein SpCBS45565_g05164 [Spizellomyces sp. 'palustris']|nr:hypothetical protein SpCBS45565_g05164 [Spizellomyces sp. 'palustris']